MLMMPASLAKARPGLTRKGLIRGEGAGAREEGRPAGWEVISRDGGAGDVAEDGLGDCSEADV